MRILLCCLALLILPAQAETLIVFGDDAYPPIIYRQDGKPAGLLPRILSRIEAETGDRYVLQLQPWKRAYVSASKGLGAIVGLSDTHERRAIFDYSERLYDDDIQIVVLKGREFPFASLDDLKGKTIGVTRGASYGEQADDAILRGLFKVDVDSLTSNRLHKLLAARFDAAFVGNGQIGLQQQLRHDSQLWAQREKIVVLPRLLARDPLYLGIPKSMNQQVLLQRFNQAILKLRKNGELQRMIDASGRE